MAPRVRAVGGGTTAAVMVLMGLGPTVSVSQEPTEIPYVADGGEKQRLDLYMPVARPGDVPIVLLVHGGSLRSGDRRDDPWPAVCRAFISEGFGCAATSYRLFPAVDWPVPAQDVAAAFAWLHEHAPSFGGDPERIALVGHSSGCLLSTLVASNGELLATHALEPTDVFGVVAIGCRLAQTPPDTDGVPADRISQAFSPGGPFERFGSLENLLSYYPMRYVGAHLPPFVALIAEEERFKPPILEDAATYIGIARDCRVDADLAILPNRTHMTAVEELASGDPTFRLIVDFMHRLSEDGPRAYLADTDRCPTAPG